MDSQTEKFISEGLSRYAEAYATVKAFEDAAAEKVGEVALTLTERLRGTGKKTKVLNGGVCNGDLGGRVAYAQFLGQWQDETPKWEIGVWWEHPTKGKRVVVYVECVDGPDALADRAWAETPAGVPGKWEAYKAGLLLELEAEGDLAEAFHRLLEVAVSQLARIRR